MAPAGDLVVWRATLSYQRLLSVPTARGSQLGEWFEVSTVAPPVMRRRCWRSTRQATTWWCGRGRRVRAARPGRHGRRFTNQGRPAGTAFEVSTDRSSPQSSPGCCDGARWLLRGGLGERRPGRGWRGHLWPAIRLAGRTTRCRVRVNAVTFDNQSHPAVAIDATDSFFVAWTSHCQDGSEDGVFGQFFDAAQQPAGPRFRSTSGRRDHKLARRCHGCRRLVAGGMGGESAEGGGGDISPELSAGRWSWRRHRRRRRW